jgi:outer membrane protein TolC
MMNSNLGRRLALTLAAVSLTLGSVAQRELSLVKAQTLGVENAYAMQRARIEVQVAKRDVKELLATGLPQVSASFDMNQFLDIPTQVAPASAFNPNAPEDEVAEFAFGTTQSATLGVNATQLIFSGSYLVGLKAAKVFAEAKDLALDASELETRRLVAEAYATALAAEANVATLDQALTLVKTSESELRSLAAEGFAQSVDADQLQLTRQALEQQLASARLQAELTLKLVLFQCGLDVTEEVTLTDNLEALTALHVPEAAPAALNVHALPSLEEQRRYLALAQLDVQNRRAEGLPQVAAFYTNSAQTFRDPDFPALAEQNKWYPAQIVGLSMSMPIWTSGGGKQRVEKAKLQVLTAESGLAQLESAARLEFEGAKAAFLDAQSALKNAKEQRALASRILTQIESGHKEGVRSSFELNTAQNQLIEAEGNLIGAQWTWISARERLIASNPLP